MLHEMRESSPPRVELAHVHDLDAVPELRIQARGCNLGVIGGLGITAQGTGCLGTGCWAVIPSVLRVPGVGLGDFCVAGLHVWRRPETVISHTLERRGGNRWNALKCGPQALLTMKLRPAALQTGSEPQPASTACTSPRRTHPPARAVHSPKGRIETVVRMASAPPGA